MRGRVFVAPVTASCTCRIAVNPASRQWMVVASRPLDPAELADSTQRRLDHFSAVELAMIMRAAVKVTPRESELTLCSIGDPIGRRRRLEMGLGSAEGSVQSTSILHVVERTPSDFVPNNAVYHAIQQLYLSSACRAALEEFIVTASSSPHENDGGGISEETGAAQSASLHEEGSVLNAAVHLESIQGARSFCFWPHQVDVASCVPYTSAYFVVLVNLKPIVAHHLLIVPRRIVRSVQELTSDEVTDWGQVLAKCFEVLKKVLPSTSDNGFSVAVQQGPLAGQTVPHLHTHVIPFDPSGLLAGEPEDDDAGARRRPRSLAEMEAETLELKTAFGGP